ncbi:transglutaminase-like domain-containing protein [Paracoccus pacificus]|uniref:Transglutaminase family protein n=1 Tax=Paracoccus pacificus TaxID=1463598 RepID=A0ABW4RCG1_9RHOB
MLIRYGYRISIQTETPAMTVIKMSPRPEVMLNARGPEVFSVSPAVPVDSYLDEFGNLCRRFTPAAGETVITADAVMGVSGLPDPVWPAAEEMPLDQLPDHVLVYTLGSRYCDTDRLAEPAWKLFGAIPPGWGRVQAVLDWVAGHLTFDYQKADATRTAYDAYRSGDAVCRDFAHLAIAFLRCLNIPARYVNGHLGDIGVPAADDPMDFSAWIEVWLSGRWWTFDPRNNAHRVGRIVLAYGRDAADVPMLNTFGPHVLKDFEVWTDEITTPDPAAGGIAMPPGHPDHVPGVAA